MGGVLLLRARGHRLTVAHLASSARAQAGRNLPEEARRRHIPLELQGPDRGEPQVHDGLRRAAHPAAAHGQRAVPPQRAPGPVRAQGRRAGKPSARAVQQGAGADGAGLVRGVLRRAQEVSQD